MCITEKTGVLEQLRQFWMNNIYQAMYLSRNTHKTRLSLINWKKCDQRFTKGFPGDSVVKNPSPSAGDAGSIPGAGRSPGEGNGNLLQYFCLENLMDRGARQSIVHRVAKSQIQLSDWARTRTHTHTHTHAISVFQATLQNMTTPNNKNQLCFHSLLVKKLGPRQAKSLTWACTASELQLTLRGVRNKPSALLWGGGKCWWPGT